MLWLDSRRCGFCWGLHRWQYWYRHQHLSSKVVAHDLLGGLGVGAALILAPMYIAEMAPAKARGRRHCCAAKHKKPALI